MIIKGLRDIQKHMESVYQNNLAAWYEHNIPDNARPNGMRKDVYISVRVKDEQRRLNAEAEAELRWQQEQATRAYNNHQMHLAMGCDDRSCTTC